MHSNAQCDLPIFEKLAPPDKYNGMMKLWDNF